MPVVWIPQRLAVIACWAVLAGCHPDVAVSPPEHQQMEYRPQALGPLVYMNQSNAEKYFVSGVYDLEANTWRWAGRRASLRFRLPQTGNLKYVMKFAVPQMVIERNGPVRLSIRINERPWQTLRYEKDGTYELERPVPPALLKPDSENTVAIELDKPLVDSGGRELGIILVYAGFQRAV